MRFYLSISKTQGSCENRQSLNRRRKNQIFGSFRQKHLLLSCLIWKKSIMFASSIYIETAYIQFTAWLFSIQILLYCCTN